MSGHITESEFWDSREHLLLAEAAAEGQKRRRPGQLVDPGPQTVEGGEFPVVAKTYNDNFPNKVPSIRSSAAQHVVKDDSIFDKYLEKTTMPEPRRARNEVSDLLINIEAMLEDHVDVTPPPYLFHVLSHPGQTGNEKTGEVLPTKCRRIDNGNDEDDGAYVQVTLDDIRDSEAISRITLQMQDRERYFEGQLTWIFQSRQVDVDVYTTFTELKHGFRDWEPQFSQVIPRTSPTSNAAYHSRKF
ncbi:hypothetical protein EDD22DRAFT_908482, partial [Suillus occidentalis]